LQTYNNSPLSVSTTGLFACVRDLFFDFETNGCQLIVGLMTVFLISPKTTVFGNEIFFEDSQETFF